MSTSQYLAFASPGPASPGLAAIECHEAGLDVEVFISFDDQTLTANGTGAAVAASCDRPAHSFAVGGASLDAATVAV